jgi:glycosyltransferase involved in cell wall biosynthesis
MVKIFTPSYADEADTNAQNLSVKEIVARLDPVRAAVTMLHEGPVDARIASRAHTKLLRWGKHGNTARTVAQILANVPDVYFFPREGPLDSAFVALRRFLRLKTALVTYVVSGGLDKGMYSPQRVRNIREADLVVANNTYLAQLLKDKVGVEAGVIYDGADRRFFFPPHPRRSYRDPVTVLFAGSLRPYKRASLVVKQAALFPETQFRIAGVGEEESQCRALAADLPNVECLGHLSPAQLGDEMRRASIFFFPSILEGHPQVLVQAAASGLPVVAMHNYRPDYVVDGTTGFLAETDEELAAKLRLLISQPELRRSMGAAALSHAQRFEWGKIALEWQQVFEKAVTIRRRN